jgi:hypothetical protein
MNYERHDAKFIWESAIEDLGYNTAYWQKNICLSKAFIHPSHESLQIKISVPYDPLCQYDPASPVTLHQFREPEPE